MLKTCPDPVDVQDVQFKLQCRFKVFDNKELNAFSQSPSLISCASRYGLLFVGSNTSNLQAVQLKCMENYSLKDKDVTNYPRRNVALASPPKHVSVNCDSTVLAVIIEKDKCPCVIFYDVLSFLKQNIKVIREARLSSTPDVFVTETSWNPAIPSIFTACKSDGTLGVYEIKDSSIDINELPKAAEATSFCWSPKGKQIAVGSKNGKITQYKPDLKAVKVINEPPLEGARSLISLQWVSNYQFIGIYQPTEAEGMAKLIVVDAPKIGEVSYTNYEDICYSGASRSPQFYMILEQHWNILLVVSSNSTELGVLASTGDTWTQCIISDSARAELPLSADHQETLPVGLALDISPTKPLPWNESFIPACPYLLILSHQGVLCVFNVVNLKEGVPSICTPPDSISDTSGVQQFVTTSHNIISAPQNVTVTVKTTTPAFTLPAMRNPPASQAPALAFGGKTLIQPQPAFAAAGSLFQTKLPENKPLLGGQATLTPIKPQQPTTQASLFGGQTLITPISKPPASAPTTTSNHNVTEKYSSIFSSLNTPTPAPITTQTKPIVISTLSIPKSEPSVQQEEAAALPKPRTLSGKLSETKTAVDIKIKGETDALLAQMIRDECVSLESELKVLLHHGRALRIDIGSDAEKVEIVSKIESLQAFIKEIVDISIGENAEVHCLKQNLIQAWAWFEEARSRYNSSKDEAMSLLLRSQPLDSSTEKRQTDIRKLMYYLESQITQASKALDEQWDSFQDYAKKTHRMQMPTMETIFQTMVRQNAILQKQSYILKDIASRLKSKTRSNSGPSLLLSIENTKDLEDNLKRLQLENPQDINQIQYERVLKRMKNLSISKTNKLRDLLKNREISHVTAAKPQLPPSLMLQSPESRTKQLISNLLSLESQLSPVKKVNTVPRQLTFVHSTPLREPSDDIEPTETPPNTPQTDLKYFTFKKIEKSNSSANLVTTASGFVPLAKSSSVFNNLSQVTTSQSMLPMHTLSAFVPTTQVSFSTSKPFSFATAATTTTTVLKTVMTTGVDTTSAFTLGTTSTPLPKFGATVKTTSLAGSAPNIVKTSTPTVKTTVPQFNFGNNLSITPVSTPKKIDAAIPTTTILGSVTAAKPLFSFGGTSNIFDTKVDSSAASKTTPTTSVTPIIGGLSQTTKRLFGAPTSFGTFTFGAGSSTSKGSAFSAVTTSTPSSAATTANSLKPEVSTPASTSEISVIPVTQLPIFGSSLNVATADNIVSKISTPMLDNSVSSTTTPGTTTTTKAASLFGNVVSSAKPQLLFGTTASSSSSFGSLTATTKPLSGLVTTPLVTTQPAVGSSGSPAFSIPAAASVKPSVSGTPTIASSTTNTSALTTITITGESTKAPIVISNVAANIATSTSAPSSFFGGTTSIFGSIPTTSEATTTEAASLFGSSTTSSTVKPSIFGSVPTSTQPSIFGASVSKTPQTSIFGGTTTTSQSLTFGTPVTATATTSVFGTTAATTQPSIFGVSSTSTTPSSIFATTQPSIFGTPTTTTSSTSIFGATTATTQPSIFGTPATTTSSSIFGAATATTQPSVFGTSTMATTTSASIFGATTAVTQPSVFGPSTSAASSNSIFGGAGTTQPSIFETSPPVATTKPSIFGVTASSTQPSIFGANTTQTSIFGTAAGTATSQTSMFGAGASTSTTKTSIFGATTSAPVTQSSVFGTNSVPSTQSSPFSVTPNTAVSPFGSAFGSAPTSAPSSPFGQSSSIFGTPKTTASPFGTTFASPSVFGSTPATTASIFGQPATFGSATPSVFGTPTTSANVFGSTTGGSTFGTVSSSSNVFGSPTVSSSFSFAGTASNAGNTGSFGFGNLNVGTATTNSNVFGGGATFGQSAASPANPFGRTAEQKSPFEGNTSVFSSPASTSSSIFGSNTGSAFGSNTQSGFGTSTFGSSSTFGQQPTFGQSTFGNTSFGSPQPGPFSTGGAGVGQSGFGSPSSFQKPSGFGSSPVFGGSPQAAFGGGPSFGGGPAFGAGPAFGSPAKIFGSNTPTGGFSSAATTNTGFGSLANQNAVGFGNLAQQASSPNASPFSGSSSFSSWR